MATLYTWDQFVAAAKTVELEGLTGDECCCLLAAIAREISGAPIASVGYTNALLYAPDPTNPIQQRRLGEIDADANCWSTVNDLITDFVRVARNYQHTEVDPTAPREARKKVYDPVPVARTLAVLAKYGIEREA